MSESVSCQNDPSLIKEQFSSSVTNTQSHVKTVNQNHSPTPRCSQIIPISTNLVSYKRTFGNSPIQIFQVSFGVGFPQKRNRRIPKTQNGQLLRSQKTSQRWCHIGLLHCVATIQRLMDTSLPAFVMATWVRSGQPENVGQEYWMGILWDSKCKYYSNMGLETSADLSWSGHSNWWKLVQCSRKWHRTLSSENKGRFSKRQRCFQWSKPRSQWFSRKTALKSKKKHTPKK